MTGSVFIEEEECLSFKRSTEIDPSVGRGFFFGGFVQRALAFLTAGKEDERRDQ